MTEIIISSLSLAFSIATVAGKKIKDYLDAVEEAKRRVSFLREEIKKNLVILEWLDKQDKSSYMVYDPTVRKQLEALRFENLKFVNDKLSSVLKSQIDKAVKGNISEKDSMYIFVTIRNAALKTEELLDLLKRTPKKKPIKTRTPVIILKRRIPALIKSHNKILQAIKEKNKTKK